MKNNTKWFWIFTICFTILAVSSIISLGPFKTLGSLNSFNNDDVKYLRSAQTFLNSGMITYKKTNVSSVFIMPGIIFLLSPFVAIFGILKAVLAFKIFQILLQILNLYLVWKIAKEIFNEKIAIVSVAISSFYLADFYATNLVLTEVCFKTLLLILTLFLIKAFKSETTKMYVIAGLMWAVAVLFRPTIALFPIVIFIIWLIKKYSLKFMLKNATIVLGIFIVILSPWWVRNYNDFGRFIPLTLSSGNPMLQGTYINYQKDPQEDALLDYSQFTYTDDEIQDDATEKAMAKYRLNKLIPVEFGKILNWYTIGKTVHQWAKPFVWEPLMNLSLKTIFIQHLIIIFFFLIGLIFSFFQKKKNYLRLFLFLIVLYFNCIHLPFYAFSRYIYPVMPFVIMFASFAILELYYCIKKFLLRKIKTTRE